MDTFRKPRRSHFYHAFLKGHRICGMRSNKTNPNYLEKIHIFLNKDPLGLAFEFQFEG